MLGPVCVCVCVCVCVLGPVSRVSLPDVPALGTLVAPFNHNHCILYFQLSQSPNIEPEICIQQKSISSHLIILTDIQMCSPKIALKVLLLSTGKTMISLFLFMGGGGGGGLTGK